MKIGKLFLLFLSLVVMSGNANANAIVVRTLNPTIVDLGCNLIDPECTGVTSDITFSIDLNVFNANEVYPFFLFDVNFDFYEGDTFSDDLVGNLSLSPDNVHGVYVVSPLSQAAFSYEFSISKEDLNALCDTGPCDGKETIFGADFYHANLGELGELEFFADGAWEFSYGATGTTLIQTRSLDNFLTIISVPEPSSLALFLLGITLLRFRQMGSNMKLFRFRR